MLARCSGTYPSASGYLVASLDTSEALRDTDPGFAVDSWYWHVSVYAAEPTWRVRTLRRRVDDRTAPLLGRGVLYPTVPDALARRQRDAERAAAWETARASAPPVPEIWASDPQGRLAPFPVALVDGDRPDDLVALYALDVQPGVDNQRHMLIHPFDAAHPRPTPGGPAIEVGIHMPAPEADADKVRSAVLSGRRAPERVLRLELKGSSHV